MLSKLTQRLIKDDIKKSEKELFIEAITTPTKMSTVDRYSLTQGNECGDIESLKNALLGVEFLDNETFDDRKKKLHDVGMATLTESVDLDKSAKRLTMKKEDYKILGDEIRTLKKSKDGDDVSSSVRKIKVFLNTVKNNLSKVSEDEPVDAFVNSIINSLCSIYCPDCKTGKDVSTKDIVTAKIYMINKSIGGK